MSKSIGAIEFKSIAKGIEVSNEIVKKTEVEILISKAICPGKFIIIVSGETGSVEECINYGLEISQNFVVSSFILNAISPEIIKAFKNQYEIIDNISTIGVVETRNVCAGIKMLDKTLKSGSVDLVKIKLSFAIGGKFVYIVSGDVSSLKHSIEESKREIKENELVHDVIIPSVQSQIINQIIKGV